jgi:hypothetical protein
MHTHKAATGFDNWTNKPKRIAVCFTAVGPVFNIWSHQAQPGVARDFFPSATGQGQHVRFRRMKERHTVRISSA